MAEPHTPPLVAVVNTSEEVAHLLQQVFEGEGFRTVATFVPDLKRRTPDPADFLLQHDPPVVVWDIALPYEENWQFFQSVQQSRAAQGRRFVLTTTNKQALEQLVGPAPAHQLIGRPFDLEEIVQAVRRALVER